MKEEKNADTSGYCGWCRCLKLSLRPHRDFEEGSAGPVYYVCKDCLLKETKVAVRISRSLF